MSRRLLSALAPLPTPFVVDSRAVRSLKKRFRPLHRMICALERRLPVPARHSLSLYGGEHRGEARARMLSLALMRVGLPD